MTGGKFIVPWLGALLPVLACWQAFAADAPPAWENSSARFQATYLWQKKPGFNAPYSDALSLIPGKEKSYTFTATAYLGYRPWQAGELYLNVELGQGVPFSGLAGLGGFSNGEVTRVAGPDPRIYRQRLFLRQTWNHGGGAQKIESDPNRMVGSVERNRFVLTAGNFSTLDVFDRNPYTGDPRAQFMNWAHMTHAAYDYAADARGYGWGVAGEWYRDDWVLRFGRATGPRKPNQLPLDYRIFRHFGDQLEIEHDHELDGLPGAVRLLVWRDRAVLASFRDALDYGNTVGWTPDPAWGRQYINNVRRGEKNKVGLGINADQALGRDLGIFLRAMWSDGRTETLAFTEVDRSLASGISLKGSGWGRAQDRLGLSFLRHEISGDRRRYLEAGGLSFFIGDGALRYRPEEIVEGYYSWNVLGTVWLTADWQRIRNPAYNADRGPANIVSARIHAEF